jgi:S-DNA-T family DNA segregation ATPase FtsK/SpoIIIE
MVEPVRTTWSPIPSVRQLGSGWAAAGYSTANIDPATRGVGLLLAETGVPRRLRCHHVTDAGVDAIVQRALALRSRFGRRS